MELRTGIEVEAAGLAAERASPADLRALAAAFGAIARAIAGGEAAIDEDFAFHRSIAAATRNPQFARFLEYLGRFIIPRQTIRVAGGANSRTAYLRTFQKEHRAILDAIRVADRSPGAQRHARHLMNRPQALPQAGRASRREAKGACAAQFPPPSWTPVGRARARNAPGRRNPGRAARTRSRARNIRSASAAERLLPHGSAPRRTAIERGREGGERGLGVGEGRVAWPRASSAVAQPRMNSLALAASRVSRGSSPCAGAVGSGVAAARPMITKSWRMRSSVRDSGPWSGSVARRKRRSGQGCRPRSSAGRRIAGAGFRPGRAARALRDRVRRSSLRRAAAGCAPSRGVMRAAVLRREAGAPGRETPGTRPRSRSRRRA